MAFVLNENLSGDDTTDEEPELVRSLMSVDQQWSVLKATMTEVGDALARAAGEVELARGMLREAKAQALIDAVADARERGEKPTMGILEARANLSPFIREAEDRVAAALEARQRMNCKWAELEVEASLLPSLFKRAARLMELDSM